MSTAGPAACADFLYPYSLLVWEYDRGWSRVRYPPPFRGSTSMSRLRDCGALRLYQSAASQGSSERAFSSSASLSPRETLPVTGQDLRPRNKG